MSPSDSILTLIELSEAYGMSMTVVDSNILRAMQRRILDSRTRVVRSLEGRERRLQQARRRRRKERGR